jgi:hypothetical protein
MEPTKLFRHCRITSASTYSSRLSFRCVYETILLKLARLSGAALSLAFLSVTGACGTSVSHDTNTLHQAGSTVQKVVSKDSVKVEKAVNKETSSPEMKKMGHSIQSQVHKGAVYLANATAPASDKNSGSNKKNAKDKSGAKNHKTHES